jgi:hypothetical protein
MAVLYELLAGARDPGPVAGREKIAPQLA